MGGLTLSPRLIDSLTPCPTVWLGRSLSEPTSHIHFLRMNFFLSKSSCQMSVIESTESDNCRNAYMFGMGFSTMHYLQQLCWDHYQGVISWLYANQFPQYNLEVLFLKLGQNVLITPFWHIPSLMPPDKSFEMGRNKTSNQSPRAGFIDDEDQGRQMVIKKPVNPQQNLSNKS